MSVAAANALTAAWAATLEGDGGVVLSGAGAYPLLALLATAAEGPAAAELAAVAPTPLELPASVRAAVGLWPRADVALTPRWRELVAGLLTDDRGALDAWAAERTGGEIPQMPVKVTEETRLVLAGALSIATAWADPFWESPMFVDAGPWRRRRLAGLYRAAASPAGLAVHSTPAGALTTATIVGADDIDVTLLIGEESQGPAALLPAAIAAADAPGAFSTDGPGVTVETGSRPGWYVAVPRFTVRADHDLLANAPVFGLATAADATRGHFPGLAAEPLAVSAAAQAATASFTAEGFRASAVTAFSMVAGSAFLSEHEQVWLTFDRPFGFLATHRPTGLVLFAGWVSDPDPFMVGSDDTAELPWDE